MLNTKNHNLKFLYLLIQSGIKHKKRGCRGRDHMVVGFTTTYAISAYHTDVVSLNIDQGEVYNIKW